MSRNRKLPKHIEWSAHEYTHQEKTPDWFWGLGLVILVIAIGAIFFNNVLLALVVLIAGAMIGFYAARHPDRFDFAATPRGIVVHDQLYPYQTLDSFWIDDLNPYEPRLLLKSQKMLVPLIVIPLEDVDVDDVHSYLLQYLPEIEAAEPVAHKLFELVGF